MSSSFRRLAITRAPITPLARHQPADQVERYGNADGAVYVRLMATVIERMLQFARGAAPKECLGVLVGRIFEDTGGRHVLVTGVVPASDAIASVASVRTTASSEARMRQLARLLYPDAVPVGWVHSHPRLGIVFSAQDRRNQASWKEEHTVGIVVDPWHTPRVGVYWGPTSERLQKLQNEDVATLRRRCRRNVPAPRRRKHRKRSRGCWARVAALAAGLALSSCIGSALFIWNWAEAELAILSNRLLNIEAGLRHLEEGGHPQTLPYSLLSAAEQSVEQISTITPGTPLALSCPAEQPPVIDKPLMCSARNSLPMASGIVEPTASASSE